MNLIVVICIVYMAKSLNISYSISDQLIESIPVLDIGRCTAPSRKLAVIAFAESEAIHKETGRKCWIASDKKGK